MKQNWQAVIGLEIHVQLNTKSKLFCGCESNYEKNKPTNTTVCPVCTGQPGALPVLNEDAVKLSVKAALSLNCKINHQSVFARKNYFYPDLPKGYQITQHDKPLAEFGYVEILTDEGQKKKINITRAHMEEDAGKSMHKNEHSLIDYNRSSMPLLEIVSEPDINSSVEAYNYLTVLKEMLIWTGISNCDMEKGELRVDVNVSLKEPKAKELGVKVEIKNLNSFRAVKDALVHEIKRQSDLLDRGEKIFQETRLWEDETGNTHAMRGKEEAKDYRYFPEPDLKPLVLEEHYINDVKKTLPEFAHQKQARFEKQYKLSDYDAKLLTINSNTADYFEEVMKCKVQSKNAANWIGSDILGKVNEHKISILDIPINPKNLAELIKFVEGGTISIKQAREVFEKMWQSSKPAKDIIEKHGFSQLSDEGQLETWAKEAIKGNPKAVEDIKRGNQKAVGALVGYVMKQSKGKANPGVVNKVFAKLLSKE
ncbi:MAG: Asp-tRNA(Asn)/Glu-tRNA(Gln) amidotransferase subunit GatB [Elusimicrobiaceae bacterium]|jgi:aspartyl-tRNA(Asn)/glutamyl-tRNA(Gln) amidotransferase subunit B|nr:Asp-tRNA(Asn)/Glu-tRNA(Gln) amidotransferase subunit GatB [Elusimicrobiaceae bacterium]MBT4008189.1 Asp-tRNA(Asn)/Glu-tRNA(Gln) amidotransferase subunit GatB [Elusimicrobiaceae bacterium]MBT4402511.1 Asp-tRNA(Asn)/Glu-tRNA(Gln) amidotransferase subunit GatB [Elusimicrobiaceae bacterium]MBT4439638.1 Asp-tRNA(Asn)/Glu-tRNA(Gln) amidotransferase subunit GatB [Elusimicrobiaceae bacterium]MBT5988068.1 Asp-tRNA(Asn)/Glu-tRNA(Gln) amidotransferase subunit GatB [Elusimicrobiaceae bacterium]